MSDRLSTDQLAGLCNALVAELAVLPAEDRRTVAVSLLASTIIATGWTPGLALLKVIGFQQVIEAERAQQGKPN